MHDIGSDRSLPCIHSFLPISSLCPVGGYEAEHAYAKRKGLKKLTLPCCYKHNPGSNSNIDGYIKRWNELCFIMLYRIDNLKNDPELNFIDWDAELMNNFAFFHELLGEKVLKRQLKLLINFYTPKKINNMTYESFHRYFGKPKIDTREHEYDAQKFISSSTALSVVDTGFSFEMLTPNQQATCSSRGTFIHQIAENYYADEFEPIWELMGLNPDHKPDDIDGYKLAVYKVFETYPKEKVKVILQEERMFDSNLGYCGMPDMIWEESNKNTIVDWKTFGGQLVEDDIYNMKFTLVTKYWSQLSSYLMLYELNTGKALDGGKLVCMMPNGKIKILEKTRAELLPYFEIFKFALRYYKSNV